MGTARRLYRRIFQWLDSPLVPLIVAAGFYLAFIHTRLERAGYDFSTFVVAGNRYCDPDRVPDDLAIQKDSAGYDGQFYYRLALDLCAGESAPLLDLAWQYQALKPEIDRAILAVAGRQEFILGSEVEAFEQEAAAFLGVLERGVAL